MTQCPAGDGRAFFCARPQGRGRRKKSAGAVSLASCQGEDLRYDGAMTSKLTDEQVAQVRAWAAEGVDLNGIQKRLATECGVHMTYMDVRFLLLDYGIEIATAPEATPAPAPEAAAPAAEAPAPAAQPDAATAPAGGKVSVTLDELQLPGTLISGKVSFPSGGSGSWFIDQAGRLGWSDLSGKPTQYEMQDFQTQLMQMLQGAM